MKSGSYEKLHKKFGKLKNGMSPAEEENYFQGNPDKRKVEKEKWQRKLTI